VVCISGNILRAFVKLYDIVGGEIGLGLFTEFISDPIIRWVNQTIGKDIHINRIPLGIP